MTMKSPREIMTAGLRRKIEREGVTAVGTHGEGTVRGLWSNDRSDPSGLDAYGETNYAMPNRYHFTALDAAGALVGPTYNQAGVMTETHVYRIGPDTYQCVDLEPSLMDDGITCVRATLSLYNLE